ncbi:MAG: DsbA family protein [Pseudomonadota bacterium]
MNVKLLAVSCVMAVMGIGGYFLTAPSADRPAGLSLGAAKAQTADVDTSVIVDMALGAEDAPVTVIEYASFTCPHCRRFHEGPFKDIKSNYIDTGKVRFVYREVYFDRFGLWGSIIARCGGEDRFFGITDMLYAQQQTWSRGAPADIAGNLRRIGLSAGLTSDQVEACFTDAEMAQTLVAWYEENAQADDVRSTPTFLINGTKYSNMSYEDFENVIQDLM